MYFSWIEQAKNAPGQLKLKHSRFYLYFDFINVTHIK